MTVYREVVKSGPYERRVAWRDDSGAEIVSVAQQVAVWEPTLSIHDGDIISAESASDYAEALREALLVIAEWSIATGRLLEQGTAPWCKAGNP